MYIDLLDQYEKYQGGFIWDYIDQALLVTDEITGREVLRYGGDVDDRPYDRPSDYEFSGNGIVFADRTEKPAMQEDGIPCKSRKRMAVSNSVSHILESDYG